MAYSAEISRQNPSCFLFLIDQSGSMSDNISGQEKSKAQAVADAVNKLLSNLTIKCAKSEGVRNYYHVGVVGYGSSVGVAFTGGLAGKELAPISDIANFPARIEERSKKVDDGAGGLIDQKVKFPIWFDPTASGGTPMTQAFAKANQIIDNWLAQYPDCFPPTVIHITDGESTDGDPKEEVKKLVSKSSSDGNVLLFNLHLSSNPNAKTLEFPSNNELLPDKYAQMLFESASLLTPFMVEVAQKDYAYLNVVPNSYGFILNGDAALLIAALDIGTRPSNLR
ncbi:vWA domain-containing protein [Runella sp.]|jgi:uncharacterized protein YegL|uniref:vWA domain-containing protein n=1 Tax=Runella sp. TaxID=1960881 RepID=UPI00262F00D0|nr:vWA domain-containing protein [Runella sp.]